MPIQQPDITRDNGPMEGETHRHPAYGQIQLHRVSGAKTLFASDFNHHSFIRMTVSPAKLRRSLSSDSIGQDGDPFIELDFSEAHWAGIVSSIGAGEGTPCTIARFNNAQVPELPRPDKREDQFVKEAEKACEDALARLHAAIEKVNASALSKRAKDEMVSELMGIESKLTSSLPFVLAQFGEHMEATVGKAKLEINAHVAQAVSRSGAVALTDRVVGRVLDYDSGAVHDATDVNEQ